MSNVLVVKERVRSILTEKFGSVEIDSDGDFSLRAGSARVFVRVAELGEESTVVRLFSIVVRGATPSDELFHHVATEGGHYYFGALSAYEAEDGTVDLRFTHRLLGDTLDPEELLGGVIAVGGTSDEIDDDLVARFGGTTFHQE